MAYMFMASDIQVPQRAAVIYAANKSVSEAWPAAKAMEMCGYNKSEGLQEVTALEPLACAGTPS